MLDAGSHRSRIAEVCTLITLDHRHTHLHIKIRVFSGTFGNTSPTRVTCNVKHWRECPAHSACSSLDRSNAGTFFYDSRIEGRSKSERNRENGTETMNHVTTDKDRNTKTALLHGSLLYGIYFCRIDAVQYRTYFSFCSLLYKPCTSGQLVHLSDLLMEGHLGKKIVDFLVYFAFWGSAGSCKCSCSCNKHQFQCFLHSVVIILLFGIFLHNPPPSRQGHP